MVKRGGSKLKYASVCVTHATVKGLRFVIWGHYGSFDRQ